jgi:glyoxylase-like metal-dependent hydrolase (beta-lactamase superfamily II)
MTMPNVYRFAGRFMELPRDHVNAYVVELHDCVVVVDTTLALSSARALREKAESFGKPIEAVLLTHGHPDHYTGLVAFEDVPRFASKGCLEFAHREDVVKSPVAESLLGDDYPRRRVFPDQIIDGGTTLTFGGTEFTFHDLGPGESDADGMWTFEQGGRTSAFIGDVAALNCHCFFRDGHAYDWLRILDDLSGRFDDRARLYLGHGSSPVGTEVLDWQRGYIRAFLHSVARLEGSPDPTGRPAQENVIAVMKDYLPTDATLFLLDYELEKTIPRYLPS